MCLTWPDCPKVPPLTDADIDANTPENYCRDCHNKDAEIARLNAAMRAMARKIHEQNNMYVGFETVSQVIDFFTKGAKDAAPK